MSSLINKLLTLKVKINRDNFTINSSIENWLALLTCFYLFISTNPYILWTIPISIVFLVVFMVIFALTFIQWYNNKLDLSTKRVFLTSLFLLFAAYMAIPVFWSDHHLFKLLQLAPLFLIVLLPNKVLQKSFKYFRSLIIFFAFTSVILFFLLLFNINVPHYIVDGFTLPMQYKNDFYRVYYLAVSSTNTVYNFGGLTIARACGPFLEPGHFAIYLGIVLAIEKILWNKLSKVLVIAGFLTFSPAFIIILFMIIVYDLVIQKNVKSLIIISTGIAIVFSVLLSNSVLREAVIFLAWNRNIADTENILNNRTRDYTLHAYKEFAKTPSIITGKGTKHMGNIGVLSDPRGIIFKFGLIGLTLTIFILLTIFSMSYKRSNLILIPIVILIYAHRSWMFESPYIYLLLILGISSDIYLRDYKSNKDQVRLK